MWLYYPFISKQNWPRTLDGCDYRLWHQHMACFTLYNGIIKLDTKVPPDILECFISSDKSRVGSNLYFHVLLGKRLFICPKQQWKLLKGFSNAIWGWLDNAEVKRSVDKLPNVGAILNYPIYIWPEWHNKNLSWFSS